MKKKPFLIIIDGPMGGGKTTVSKLLQQKLHKKRGFTALVSLDSLKRIVSGYYMTSRDHLATASQIGMVMSKEYLKKGMGVIVEKAFTRAKFLKLFIKPFREKFSVFIYQIEAPEKMRFKRVMKRKLNPGVKKRQLKKRFFENSKSYSNLRYKKAKVFDSSKLTPTQIVNRIMKDIK